MPRRDYYKILGVARDAKLREIKKKYRELAKKYHPDANNGSKKAEIQFKVLSEAYSTLGNAKKRREYDRKHPSRGPSRKRTTEDWSPPPGGRWGYGFGNYEARGRTQYDGSFDRTATEEPPPPDPDAPTRGFDLQFMIDVPFTTVALGGAVPYIYEKYVECGACVGTGESSGETCKTCEGKRRVVKEVFLDVKIPPGVADKYILRIQDEGGAGMNGGPPGDLFLKICTEPHPNFKRKKSDIYAETLISSELAEKGGTLNVETLDAVKTIEVEEGTLTGEELRLPGEGAAILWGKKRGDFIVKFAIADK